MNRYHIIKRVKKLMERLSIHLNAYSILGKSNNANVAKMQNLRDDLFQELGVKPNQPETKEVELPKYLFI